MSQQAAIRAEKERVAQQRRDMYTAWLGRVRRWGVPVLAAVVMVMGLVSWAGAGAGSSSTLAHYERVTGQARERAEAAEAEMGEIWAATVRDAAKVDPARIEADSATINELVKAVAQGEREGAAKATELGVATELAGFLDRREEVLGGFQVPGVHQVRVDLHHKVGQTNEYVVTAWLVDTVTVPIGQPTDDPITPAAEHSRWAVLLVQTGPTGDLVDVEAHWVDGEPLNS